MAKLCFRLAFLVAGSAVVAATASVFWTTSFAAAQTSSAAPVALELDRNAETATWKFNENERSESKKRTFTATPKLRDADFDGLDAGFPNDIENEDGRAFPEDNVTVTKRPKWPGRFARPHGGRHVEFH
jgi:hypothetical protein